MNIEQTLPSSFTGIELPKFEAKPGSKPAIGASVAYAQNSQSGVLSWISTPVLDLPKFNLSAITVSVSGQMAAMDHETLKTQAAMADSFVARQKDHYKETERLQNEIMEKNREKAKFDPAQKALNWLGKIAGLIGAIIGVAAAYAASVATGGVVVGLAIAATIGVISAVADITDGIAQELNVEVTGANGQKVKLQFNLGGLVEHVTQSIEADPVAKKALGLDDPTKRASWVTGWTVFANVAVAAAMIGSMAKGMHTVAKTSLEAGNAAMSAATKGLEIGSQVFDATVAITSGGVAIHVALLKADAENSLAHKKFQDALINLLSRSLQANNTAMMNIFQNVQSKLESASNMIQESHATASASVRGISTA
ncbi:type III secretion system translocon subunit SctE [Lacisediminimonas sp.]|uniref:type III secretion system translocon subunit SctE n=1 Tax=Lacisediminimonas sp. TaxID=3060582 RepID=UPI0027181E2F|nr:type III secretion system translocon subunit SctE [Lacisediminimonas sp.]MDO8300186.1 type III secretion system translocon subunit SctE [Lacisediminimonas sp.]